MENIIEYLSSFRPYVIASEYGVVHENIYASIENGLVVFRYTPEINLVITGSRYYSANRYPVPSDFVYAFKLDDDDVVAFCSGERTRMMKDIDISIIIQFINTGFSTRDSVNMAIKWSKKEMARRRKLHARNKTMVFYLNDKERELLVSAALKEDKSVSEYVRDLVLDVISKV